VKWGRVSTPRALSRARVAPCSAMNTQPKRRDNAVPSIRPALIPAPTRRRCYEAGVRHGTGVNSFPGSGTVRAAPFHGHISTGNRPGPPRTCPKHFGYHRSPRDTRCTRTWRTSPEAMAVAALERRRPNAPSESRRAPWQIESCAVDTPSITSPRQRRTPSGGKLAQTHSIGFIARRARPIFDERTGRT